MSKAFWEQEYRNPKHLKMSDEPSGDLIDFINWAERNAEWPAFPSGGTVLDIGCGNGRNLIYLFKESQMKGVGIDLSGAAITQAKNNTKGMPITLSVQNARDTLQLPDESVDVALDMMTSHYLHKKERTALTKEIARVLKPYGWLYLKTFFLDDDAHAKRMIKDFPGKEEQTYIHPIMKLEEFVYTEHDIYTTFGPYFKIHRILKSHKHIRDGKPYKRRTISVYMEKLPS